MKYQAALVLEGGGMRASYTNGVLDYFLEHNIDFNYVVGVSAGCTTGMNFIAKQKGRSCTLSVEYASDKNVVGLKPFLTKGSYFNLDYIYNKLDTIVPFDYDTFNNDSSAFWAGCYNVETGMVDYFNKDKIKESRDCLIASSSLPIISKIVKIDGIKYLDGGIKDSIPLDKAINDGNKKRVIILTNPIEYRREAEKSIKLIQLLYFRYPKLIASLKDRHNVYNKMITKINQMEKDNEVFVIRPSVKLNVTRYSKDSASLLETYQQGLKDAGEVHDKLLKYLNE